MATDLGGVYSAAAKSHRSPKAGVGLQAQQLKVVQCSVALERRSGCGPGQVGRARKCSCPVPRVEAVLVRWCFGRRTDIKPVSSPCVLFRRGHTRSWPTRVVADVSLGRRIDVNVSRNDCSEQVQLALR